MSLNLLYPDYHSHRKYRGALMISGFADMGAEDCFLSVLDDFTKESGPVILLSADAGGISHETLRFLSARRDIRFLNCSWNAPDLPVFNLLSASDTAPGKASLIAGFLLDITDISRTLDTAQRLLRDAVLASSISGEAVRLKNVLKWDPDRIHEMLHRSHALSEHFLREEDMFLATEAASTCWVELNTRAATLSSKTLEALSGEMSVRELFAPKTLTLLKVPSGTSADARSAMRFFRGVSEMILLQLKALNDRKECWHTAAYNGDGIPPDLLRQFLERSADARHLSVPLCLYQTQVSKLLNVCGTDIAGQFGGYAVFCTTEGSYWSQVFGTSLRPEITQTFGAGKTAAQQIRGGVVTHPGGKKTTTTVSRVEKLTYEARAFSDLRENAFLWYSVREKRRGRREWR